MAIENKNDFARVDDKYAGGSSLIKHREGGNETAPIGDFMSRIWYLFGKPNLFLTKGLIILLKILRPA